MKPFTVTEITGMNLTDFFITDIHGRYDLMSKLLSFLLRHSAMRGTEPRFTFMGDIVDRGPDSKECVETAIQFARRFPGSEILLGNHEDMMLDAIETGGKSEKSGTWALNGGMETVRSYAGNANIRGFLAGFSDGGPFEEHFKVLRAAPLSVEREGLFVVHAGVSFDKPFDRQTPNDMLWIREPFLDAVTDGSAPPVVHGHTVVGMRPVVTENRVSLDTGSYENERLTAMIVDHPTWDISFAQASFSGVRYVEPLRLDRGYGTVLDNPARFFERSPTPLSADKTPITMPQP